jgi:ubiquinone/menaquinone biosynthesis C-methylase UbiE
MVRAARAQHGAALQVIGVDHSLPMLLEARRRAREAGLPISYVRASAQALPLRSGAANGVTIGGSLNEIGDVDTCLSEARRLLDRGGQLVMMSLARAATPVGEGVQRLLRPAGIAFWTPEELTERLARHGLRTLRREQYGIVLFTLAVPASGVPRHGEAVHAD